MKTGDVKRALDAVPPFAWLAIAAGVVALYLAKRASDAAGKGVDAVVDFLKPGPQIENVREIKGQTRVNRWATFYARNDNRQYTLRAEAGDFNATLNWALYMNGVLDDRGTLELEAGAPATIFKVWPRQLDPMRRYELKISNAEGEDVEQVLAWGGVANSDF